MKQIHDIWLPDEEQHFVERLKGLAEEGKSQRYPALTEALKYVNKRRVAVDIGAHVGLWSRWLVREFIMVYAFEPVDEYADLFLKNVRKGFAMLHRVALGAHVQSVAMKLYPQDTGRAHISGSGEIPMRTLDSYGYHPDLIKIDVEGYELPVLQGAEQTLVDSMPIVIVEQRGCDKINFGQTQDALAYLEDLGMKRIAQVHLDYIMGW